MVLHTCHAILRDRHAAEDALQATFLVLAQVGIALDSRLARALALWRRLPGRPVRPLFGDTTRDRHERKAGARKGTDGRGRDLG